MAHTNGEASKMETGGSTPYSMADSMPSTWSTKSRAEANLERGMALHHAIPKHLWCVNEADLREFRDQVLVFIRAKRIVPTETDNFDPDDERTGPSIYTVNEQFIKPRTLKGGGSSWALMKHPGGLKCDLFITHAWSEGVFEFIDKVLQSWPLGASGAYCCMLSNPQNLDISALINDPLDSPFYHALFSASHVLVVPNHDRSIYTRLWCVFEAHLAYQWDKIIVTATSSPNHAFIKSIWLLVLFFALGAVAGFAGASVDVDEKPCSAYIDTCPAWCRYHEDSSTSRTTCDGLVLQTRFGMCTVLLLVVFLVTSTMTTLEKVQLASNCSGVLLCGFIWGMFHEELSDENEVMQYWTFFLAALILFVSDLDRIRFRKFCGCVRQLQKGFVRVEDASCSCPTDRASLHDVLAGNWPNVKHTVNVLMKAGISTPSIRFADEIGLSIERIAFAKYTPCVLTWIRWMTVSLQSIREASDGAVWIPIVSSGCGLLWALMWLVSARDQQLWLTTTISKFIIFMYLPKEWFFEVLELRIVLLVVSCMIVAIACAGLRRVAALPFVGPQLAQLLLCQELCLNPMCLRVQRRMESYVTAGSKLMSPEQMAVPFPPPNLRRSSSDPVELTPSAAALGGEGSQSLLVRLRCAWSWPLTALDKRTLPGSNLEIHEEELFESGGAMPVGPEQFVSVSLQPSSLRCKVDRTVDEASLAVGNALQQGAEAGLADGRLTDEARPCGHHARLDAISGGGESPTPVPAGPGCCKLSL
eukprot:TRINITY_DN19356_c0_g1_i3.p1 TRINITY_DN19356_c0_g1~~TRINITY_DN19356_c0_g1_i3.p1  ORF type:complete len:757 (+),score=37.20 TRINITY_DN19356_c0_g1_i3:104-2374(+)